MLQVNPVVEVPSILGEPYATVPVQLFVVGFQSHSFATWQSLLPPPLPPAAHLTPGVAVESAVNTWVSAPTGSRTTLVPSRTRRSPLVVNPAKLLRASCAVFAFVPPFAIGSTPVTVVVDKSTAPTASSVALTTPAAKAVVPIGPVTSPARLPVKPAAFPVQLPELPLMFPENVPVTVPVNVGLSSGGLSATFPSSLSMAVRIESVAVTVPDPDTKPVMAFPVTTDAAIAVVPIGPVTSPAGVAPLTPLLTVEST